MSGWRNSFGVSAVLAVLLAGACKEDVTAPGKCPALCPGTEVQVIDTVLTGAIAGDTSFRGFFHVQDSPLLVAADFADYQAIPIVRFTARPTYWITGTDTIHLASVDSVRLTIQLTRRDTSAHNLRLLIYRVPVDSIDSTATYARMAPMLTPANFVDSIAIPDSIVDKSLVHVLPAGAFTPDTTGADSGHVAAAIWLRADTGTGLTLASANLTGAPARLEWFARGADTSKTQTLSATPEFDSFVQSPEPPAPTATELMIGGLPAARALIRFAIPSYFIDSTTVVKATLVLTPTAAPTGLPNDSFVLQAHAIVRDYGPKSFFLTQSNFSGGVEVVRGDSAELRLDVTQILRSWKGISPDSLPRTIMLLSGNEGASLDEVHLASTVAGSGTPYLHLTYVKPYTFGVP